jgi:hypothetical protein
VKNLSVTNVPATLSVKNVLVVKATVVTSHSIVSAKTPTATSVTSERVMTRTTANKTVVRNLGFKPHCLPRRIPVNAADPTLILMDPVFVWNSSRVRFHHPQLSSLLLSLLLPLSSMS